MDAEMDILRNDLLAKLDGLPYGENPRQGYVDGSVFYHPQLRFQFPVPAGWNVNNTAAQVQMFNQDQSAVILFSMSPDITPAAAAEAFHKESKAAAVKSERTQVNGMPAHRLISDITTEQGPLRVLSYFIQKEQDVFVFLGYTGQARFDGHFPVFDQTMSRFKNLTDARKINVKAERLAVKKTTTQGSLRQAFRKFGEREDRGEALAIINGMKLDAAVPVNTYLKVVVK